MNILKKIKTFFSLEMTTMLLIIEAFIYLGWARILKSMPFAKVASTLGVPMNETPLSNNPSNSKLLTHISTAIHITSAHTFWESKCLVRAIAGMKMLERRQIESTLYLGTAKDESGKMIAHAWLRSGPFYITGAEEMQKFIVVGKFARTICQKI
ncbi:Transglutaminase-like superfamily protein [Paenibacillus sp. 1_12]|uniref:lasso peptide biosynthesis B2 protein n=1 Tax=Paenibacillus sp. 1_12 TaxID=1566278 RepID=UPI0008E8C136|nr:lasso peptide biosynthesis B2 protein [Paenibacillus sp. 1_12]SFL10847.1 Transglutaminase-like superfamily protein [Paenibacillus sp. 1_12]